MLLPSLRATEAAVGHVSGVCCGGAGLTRLEVNGLASCAEAEAVCSQFWQLAAPEGVPLGALPDSGGAHGRCIPIPK